MNFKRLTKSNWIIIILFTFIAITSMSFVLTFLFLPEKIHIIQGEKHTFSFQFPFRASFDSNENISAVKINNQPLENDIQVHMNQFSIESESPGSMNMELSLFGVIPVKTVTVDTIKRTSVIPSGNTVGVKIKTDGIMVLGTGYINGDDGSTHEPSKGVFKTGDLIMEVNGKAVESKEDLMNEVEQSEGFPISLIIHRDGEEIHTSIEPVYSMDDNKYKIGIWVRDSTQGIGTMTYYNPDSGQFGALGHGILDVDTKQLMSIKEGEILEAEITSVKKGIKGTPGELVGEINTKSIIGEVTENTDLGIYGYIENSSYFEEEAIEIGLQHEVHEGPAVIYSNISGDKVESYEVEIQKVMKYTDDESKGMILKITDERLIGETGGIVQGMSGSPILQDGRLIGAVTHVFVQDPLKGYGIFIENMLKQESEVNQSTAA